MVRYVVHPPGITETPIALADRLSAQGLHTYPVPVGDPNYASGFFSFTDDLFLVYPEPQYVRDGASDEYVALYGFFSRHKLGQRQRLHKAGLPIPETIGRHGAAISANPLGYIVRPLRHSGGRNYRRTHDPADFVEDKEYLSGVFSKDREFRVIFCCGEYVVTLDKIPPIGADAAASWNHEAGARFRTIENAADDPLAATDLYGRLSAVPFLSSAYLLGIDVMMAADGRYALLEVNACPGLKIERNLRDVVARLRARQAAGSD